MNIPAMLDPVRLGFVTLLTLAPSLALAAGTRYFPTSECQVISGTASYSNGQIVNNDTADLQLLCPLTSDPTVSLPAGGSPNVVRVDGWCNTASPAWCAATVSVSHRNGGASTSAQGDNSHSIGIFHLAPTTPSLVTGDYPYVGVKLTTGSALFGYYMIQ